MAKKINPDSYNFFLAGGNTPAEAAQLAQMFPYGVPQVDQAAHLAKVRARQERDNRKPLCNPIPPEAKEANKRK